MSFSVESPIIRVLWPKGGPISGIASSSSRLLTAFGGRICISPYSLYAIMNISRHLVALWRAFFCTAETRAPYRNCSAVMRDGARPFSMIAGSRDRRRTPESTTLSAIILQTNGPGWCYTTTNLRPPETNLSNAVIPSLGPWRGLILGTLHVVKHADLCGSLLKPESMPWAGPTGTYRGLIGHHSFVRCRANTGTPPSRFRNPSVTRWTRMLGMFH